MTQFHDCFNPSDACNQHRLVGERSERMPRSSRPLAKQVEASESSTSERVLRAGRRGEKTDLVFRSRAASYKQKPLRVSERASCASERAEWPPMANESSGRTPEERLSLL